MSKMTQIHRIKARSGLIEVPEDAYLGNPLVATLCNSLTGEIAEREADLARIEALKKAGRLLPCLDKARSNGKGIVPVPEWVIAEIAATLAEEKKP